MDFVSFSKFLVTVFEDTVHHIFTVYNNLTKCYFPAFKTVVKKKNTHTEDIVASNLNVVGMIE